MKKVKQKKIYVVIQVNGHSACAVVAFANLERAIAARDERNKTNTRHDSIALDNYAKVESVTLIA